MKKTKETTVSERNFISQNTSIKGDIIAKGDFRIDGTLEGNFKTTGRVVIGKQGFVNGNITCANAEIEGKVSGSIRTSDVLSLKSTALVEGDVHIAKLSVEPGAIFNVKCNMKEENIQKK